MSVAMRKSPQVAIKKSADPTHPLGRQGGGYDRGRGRGTKR